MPVAKLPLVIIPTPIHRLNNLSSEIGVDLWIKRDDLTGFAMGGNKGRKLEYLIADALKEGATVVVTCGSRQSNFVRQLGAACAMHGLRCVAAVMDLPFDSAAGKPRGAHPSGGGNEILNHWLGVELHHFPDDDWEVLYQYAETLAFALESKGETVYRIPVGGSSPLGALSFYEAGREMLAQGVKIATVVTASSSGSTQVGLTYALASEGVKVVGIVSDPEPEIVHDFVKIGEGLAELLGVKPLGPNAFLLDFDSVGPGYGVSSPEGEEAIRLMATREGIFLDPVYSGKAFAGLLRLARKGKLEGPVLFWHTGGMPTLFATAD
ncbi:MAG: D-cysteine desulfhydrase family protein [Armatimonadetes bacterium]|nr:D-cysteine desulfhydrase family protein [Armatimonadota bacterium]